MRRSYFELLASSGFDWDTVPVTCVLQHRITGLVLFPKTVEALDLFFFWWQEGINGCLGSHQNFGISADLSNSVRIRHGSKEYMGHVHVFPTSPWSFPWSYRLIHSYWRAVCVRLQRIQQPFSAGDNCLLWIFNWQGKGLRDWLCSFSSIKTLSLMYHTKIKVPADVYIWDGSANANLSRFLLERKL